VGGRSPGRSWAGSSASIRSGGRRRRVPRARVDVRPGRVRPRGAGAHGASGGHALRRHHDAPPQRLLHVRHQGQRPHRDALARRSRSHSRDGRRVPRRGPADRPVLLAVGLVAPRLPAVHGGDEAVPSRPLASAADRRAGGALPLLPARTARRADDGVRADRRDLVRRRLGAAGAVVGAGRDRGTVARQPARDPHQQPPPRPRRLRHTRAVHPADQPRWPVGVVPDDERELGVQPGRSALQVGAGDRPRAVRDRRPRRQPAAQREPARRRVTAPRAARAVGGARDVDGRARLRHPRARRRASSRGSSTGRRRGATVGSTSSC
jgi:hypothetical protein